MHIGRGNQYFKGDCLFHTEVEIFVPGGTHISGVPILRDCSIFVKKKSSGTSLGGSHFQRGSKFYSEINSGGGGSIFLKKLVSGEPILGVHYFCHDIFY